MKPVQGACALISLFLILIPTFAMSCGFHSVTSRKSIVSTLMESEMIVLAIADPEDPFRYLPVEAIRGTVHGPHVPFLVDSSTRKKLTLNVRDRVLFAFEEASGQWTKLSYIDDKRAPIFQEIFDNLDQWQIRGQDRFVYFGSLANHRDLWVRNLALTELDQAPYVVLRSIDFQPDTKKLISDIKNPKAFRLEAIRVMLLGLSEDEKARRYLHENLERNLGWRQDKLIGAYATAIIESDGARGLDALKKAISRSTQLSAQSREAIALSLTTHHLYGPRELRAAIGENIRSLIRSDAGFDAAFSQTLKPILAKSRVSARRGVKFDSGRP